MKEEDSESNIDWGKDKGVSKNTRISRRLDQKKAMAADEASKTSKKTTKNVTKITPNLKKIKSKIRDVFDEDDEDDDDGKTSLLFDLAFEQVGSSLYDALHEEEKTRLNANKEIDNLKMQETAGKVAGILRASEKSKELGLKEMSKKVIAKKTMDVTYDQRIYESSLLENISLQTKLKTDTLSSKEAKSFIEGLEKMKKAGIINSEQTLNKLSENMDVKDITSVGKEKNNKKNAKLILEKSGRITKESKKKEPDKEQKKEKLKQIEKNLDKIKQR